MALEKTELTNGLTIYNDRIPGSYVNNVSMFIPFGSVHEKPGEEGIAHVLEHCVHLETDQFADRQSLLQSARLNSMATDATTSFSSTRYYANGIHLESSFTHLSEVLQHTHFPEDKVIDELKAIHQEARKHEENPDLLHAFSAQHAIFGNPYGRDIFGYHDKITFTADEIRALHNQYYRLGNMALVVSGAATTEEVAKLAGEYFVDTSGQTADIQQPAPPKLGTHHRTGFIIDKSSSVRISVSRPLTNEIKNDLMSSTMAFGIAEKVMSIACFQLLRYEKGLAYGAGAGFDTSNHRNSWDLVGYVTTDGATSAEAEAAIEEIFSRDSNQYSEESIRAELAMYKYGFMKRLTSTDARSDQHLSRLSRGNKPEDIESQLDELQNITENVIRGKIDAIVNFAATAPKYTHLSGTREDIGDVERIIEKTDFS